MELCSGGRVHQPVRDRGGEGPAHGEVAPSLGFDTQVLFLDSLYDSKIANYICSTNTCSSLSTWISFSLLDFIQSLVTFVPCLQIICIFSCQFRRESRNSLSISVQKLCSTHKLYICPMNCKYF